MLAQDVSKASLSILDRESVELIESFVTSQIDESGGFKGRDGKPDLYYTLFGLDCLATLGATIDGYGLRPFLDRFNDGENLDFVEFTCLTRCLFRIGELQKAQHLARGLDRFRSHAGGYCPDLAWRNDSIYSSYLALQTLTELGHELRDNAEIQASVLRLRLDDGSYGERSGLETGTTTVTSAAVMLLTASAEVIDEETINWLEKRRHESGGFCASPLTPLPDLLSTAAAEFALSAAGVNRVERGADVAAFVEDLWQDNGGFSGHIMDSTPDCEYTFYALLTLGLSADHLA